MCPFRGKIQAGIALQQWIRGWKALDCWITAGGIWEANHHPPYCPILSQRSFRLLLRAAGSEIKPHAQIPPCHSSQRGRTSLWPVPATELAQLSPKGSGVLELVQTSSKLFISWPLRSVEQWADASLLQEQLFGSSHTTAASERAPGTEGPTRVPGVQTPHEQPFQGSLCTSTSFDVA